MISEIRKQKKSRIILSNPVTITGIIAIAYMKAMHIPYALQVEGGFPKKKRGLIGFFKRFAFSGASHYYSSSKVTDQYLIINGAKSNRISRFPFTSVGKGDINQLTKSQKKQIRKNLGLEDVFTILYVGQFIPRKGIDILLEALGRCDKLIQAVLIGGKPTEEYSKMVEQYELTRVYFKGFQSKDMVKKWMQAADVFVMPTRYDIWGLVVNEAMSQGLPVISSNNCIAAKEMIVPGKNGFIFESENIIELSAIITELWQTGKWQEMKKHAYQTASEYTFEEMVEAHFGEW